MAIPQVTSYLKNVGPAVEVNARVKARIHERRAAFGQRRYERRARQLGISSLTPDQLQAQLRDRLASRADRRWPKPPGELHLFLAYAVSNWESILPTALAPFGEVTEFEWRSRGYDEGCEDWLQQRDRMQASMLDAFHAANNRRPVDAVVGYLSGHNTSPETLQTMAAAGAAVFNFCWDDKVNFPGPRIGGRYKSPAAIAHAVDLNLTNAPDSVVKYAVHGGLAKFWPEAGHPDVHRPYDDPFEFDVSFVGARYGWRPTFIRKLQQQGISVACFGKGWSNGPLSDEEMVRLYSRSRINLGFGGIGYSRKLTCLKGRDFEVPLSGGLYLTQDNPELQLVFRLGQEIVTYRDADDCAATIRRLLANPQQAAAIRQAGRARCLSEHTYQARWSEVLEMAGILTSPATARGTAA